MRYSKQREAILRVLDERLDHPTAQQIYEVVRAELPQISLGTVYRNLDQLSEAGAVLEVQTGQGPARYDRRTDDHQHFRCIECGKVMDIEAFAADELGALMKGRIPGSVSSYTLNLAGICDECSACKRGEDGFQGKDHHA